MADTPLATETTQTQIENKQITNIEDLGRVAEPGVNFNRTTGAINIRNEAGSVDARTVHTTLMALLNSNWAAVTDTDGWTAALGTGSALAGSNLVVSATS